MSLSNKDIIIGTVQFEKKYSLTSNKKTDFDQAKAILKREYNKKITTYFRVYSV